MSDVRTCYRCCGELTNLRSRWGWCAKCEWWVEPGAGALCAVGKVVRES